MKLQVRAATEIEKGESCYGAEISCAAEGYQLYRNNKNENKYIEVKKSKDGHTWMRQFMYWNMPEGTVKNYNGSKTNRGRYHRVTLETLAKILEDYDSVEDVHEEMDSIEESTSVDDASDDSSETNDELWPEELTFEDYDEGDQIIEVLIDAVGDLGIFEEASARGGFGTDFFYDDEGGDIIGLIDLEDEQEQLQDLYFNSKSRNDFKQKVIHWLKDLCGLNKKKSNRQVKWNENFSHGMGLIEIDEICRCLEEAADALGWDISIPDRRSESHDASLMNHSTGDIVKEFNMVLAGPDIRKKYSSSKTREEYIEWLKDFLKNV